MNTRDNMYIYLLLERYIMNNDGNIVCKLERKGVICRCTGPLVNVAEINNLPYLRTFCNRSKA